MLFLIERKVVPDVTTTFISYHEAAGLALIVHIADTDKASIARHEIVVHVFVWGFFDEGQFKDVAVLRYCSWIERIIAEIMKQMQYQIIRSFLFAGETRSFMERGLLE